MNEFKKLELRLSELRTEINGLMAVDDPSAEQRDQLTKLQAEWTEKEAKYQEYLRGQISEEEKRDAENSPEAREYKKLQSEIMLSNYLSQIIEGRTAFDGREQEFNQHLKIPGIQIPMEAFMPRGEPRGYRSIRPPEERQDVATSIASNADVPVQGHPILGRVFAYSDLEFLGLTMVMAGVGEQTFPVMTAGVAPAYAAPGAAKNAEAATYTFTQLDPLAFASRYLFRREDAARLPMFEDSLRRDMSNAMANYLAGHVLNGTATPVGFRPHSQGTRIAAGNFGSRVGGATSIAAVNIAEFLEVMHYFPDGRWAGTVAEVYILFSRAINQGINSKLDSSNRPYFLSELLRNFGGYKVSGHLPETTVSSKKREAMMVIARGQGTPGSAVMVMWPSVELIYDPFSKAANREVLLTSSGLWNFSILRSDPWRSYYVQTEA